MSDASGVDPIQQPVGAEPQRAYQSLLAQVMSTTLDQDYAVRAAKRAAQSTGDGGKPARPTAGKALLLGVALAAFGLMIGVSAIQTARDRPAAVAERSQLVDQIHARQDRLDGLHGELSSLQADVTRLQASLADEAAADQTLAGALDNLGVAAGTIAVTGSGLQITADDAVNSGSGSGGTILDRDLQQLVNGLWAAGAEAISINGHRLTSLTSIRYAGEAITVDYRSITPPYVVRAIGDPAQLQQRFLASTDGQTWIGLQATFGILFEISSSDKMTLPADPHEHLQYAVSAETDVSGEEGQP